MNNPPDNTSKNLLEWTVFAISAVLVLAVLGYLLKSALEVEIGPAKLAVMTGPPVAENGRTRIPVTVSNDGRRVAANVEVQIAVDSGEGKQQAGFTLDFVPRGGSRQGAVSFKGTDLTGTPECEVLGYEEP